MKGLARELAGSGVTARLSPGMMLTDFITKTPDGEPSEVILDKRFRKIFNIMADRPETAAKIFHPENAGQHQKQCPYRLAERRKAAWRFMTAGIRKRKLI